MPDKNFMEAMETVLSHEGGFVDDPDDPGGATNFGVSLRFLATQGAFVSDGDGVGDYDFDRDGDIDADDIRNMTREDAIKVYREQWWGKYDYGTLPPGVGAKVFDLSVNMGARQAHKLLQRACRSCGENIVDDGILGPVTRAVIADADQWALLTALRSEAAGFYRALVAGKPQFAKFREGWLRRAYA